MHNLFIGIKFIGSTSTEPEVIQLSSPQVGQVKKRDERKKKKGTLKKNKLILGSMEKGFLRKQ